VKGYEFDWSILWGEWGLRLLDGLWVTVQLAAVSLVLSLALGVVFGVARWSEVRVLRPLCWAYVELARNVPPLVQILFWYFSAKLILPAPVFLWLRNVGYEFAAAAVALTLYHGAFVAEIVRAGFAAIPRGQFDAARSLGLRFLPMVRLVVLPQVVRIVVPPLTNEAAGLVKNTSLALAIGVAEIAYQTKYIDTYTFRGVEALSAATVLYLVLCLAMSGLGKLASDRFSRHTVSGHAVGTGLD
jgi:polar amino acid transport system permease protein